MSSKIEEFFVTRCWIHKLFSLDLCPSVMSEFDKMNLKARKRQNTKFEDLFSLLVTNPGGTLNFFFFFFGACVPHRFPKVGSEERIGFSWKNESIGNKNLEKFGSRELKVWPKQG